MRSKAFWISEYNYCGLPWNVLQSVPDVSQANQDLKSNFKMQAGGTLRTVLFMNCQKKNFVWDVQKSPFKALELSECKLYYDVVGNALKRTSGISQAKWGLKSNFKMQVWGNFAHGLAFGPSKRTSPETSEKAILRHLNFRSTTILRSGRECLKTHVRRLTGKMRPEIKIWNRGRETFCTVSLLDCRKKSFVWDVWKSPFKTLELSEFNFCGPSQSIGLLCKITKKVIKIVKTKTFCMKLKTVLLKK